MDKCIITDDDDEFAFADSADTEASQPAADTTNLEVLQFTFWMIARRNWRLDYGTV